MKQMRLLLMIALTFSVFHSRAAEAPAVLPVAVFDFHSDDLDEQDLGAKIATLISVRLSAEPGLILVERAELEKLLGEQELNLSGNISGGTGAALGQLSGAKVLVTGRAIRSGKELILVSKIMGAETGRVYGEMARGGSESPIADLSDALARQIAAVIESKAETLVARPRTREDRLESIRSQLKEGERPVIYLSIPERHFGGPTFDPAAETEIGRMLTECGFKLVDEKAQQKPNLELTGEAFSEFGLRRGNLVSCKARIELKLRDLAAGEILLVDRQTTVSVDISEQIAAKTALQNAAGQLAERVIPKIPF